MIPKTPLPLGEGSRALHFALYTLDLIQGPGMWF
jgi:hypothetical protein